MSTSTELEVLDELLDSGRKVHKYVEELLPNEPKRAAEIKQRLNYLCDRALAIYFYGDSKQAEFQQLVHEVQSLAGSKSQLAA